MKNITTTTPVNTEGCNISYSSEQNCGERLLKVLPIGWKVSFKWCQILFSDVQYEIDKDKKFIQIYYNQNLYRWWDAVTKDILKKIE